MTLGPSELILNADGSVYHLNLLPEDIADTVITVGDPDRVSEISECFDAIELKKGKREFLTHTGIFRGKRLTVISTGIGTDNIDIVLNELDALVNIDFKNRTVHPQLKSLDIIRIGTSGAIQSDIPVDSFVLSEYAIGFDGLLHFYESHSGQGGEYVQDWEMAKAFVQQTQWDARKAMPYVVGGNKTLARKLDSNRIRWGITATNTGFYGPQGRTLRLPSSDRNMLQKITAFLYKGRRITNLEMETSGIYGLALLLGHRAISMNCILANRATGKFSKNPEKATQELIHYCLEKICG